MSGLAVRARDVLRLGLRPLEPTDASAVAHVSEGMLGRREVRGRLESGMLGFGAWSGDELIAFTWAHPRVLDWAPCRRPLENEEVYLFGATTARERLAARVRARFIHVNLWGVWSANWLVRGTP